MAHHLRSRETHGASVIFMCRPSCAFVNPVAAEDNTWMDTSIETNDTTLKRYVKEHANLVKLLQQRGVLVVNAQWGRDEGGMNKPDSIFMNNSVSIHARKPSASSPLAFTTVLYPMSPGRRDEVPSRLLRALESLGNLFPGSKVEDLRQLEERGLICEGTGAFVFDAEDTCAVYSRSQRMCDQAVVPALRAIGIDPLRCAAFTTYNEDRKPVYHTNIVGWRGHRIAAYCREAMEFTSEVEEMRFEELHKDTFMLELSRHEMNHFCGNALEVTSSSEGRRLLVMSQTAYAHLSEGNKRMLHRHYGADGIIAAPIPTIETIGGGSVRCLLTHCSLPPTTTLQEAKTFVDWFEEATCEDGREAAAEWHQPSLVLVHAPNSGGELVVPGLHPESALFEGPFDPIAVARQHADFVRRLRTSTQVVTVKEALLAGTQEDGDALRRLRALALQSITLEPETEEHRRKVERAVERYSPEQLFHVVMQHPTMRFTATPGVNTEIHAAYEIHPLSNLIYCRDQSITTNAGRVLARLASPQRAMETTIIRAALEALGQPPIYEIQAPGTLEGGDFIVAGDYAFVGCGLRTNFDAIRQLMANDCFRCRFVVVVNDQRLKQDEMHLDTYFNIIARDLCVLLAPRETAAAGNEYHTTCDVYEFSAMTPVNSCVDLPASWKQDSKELGELYLTEEDVPDAQATSSDADSTRSPYVNAELSPQDAAIRATVRAEAKNAEPGFALSERTGLRGAQTHGAYSKVKENVPFASLLRSIGFSVLPVSKADQLVYGCNFLTTGPREVLFVKSGEQGVSADYRQQLEAHRVQYTEIEMSEITQLYGALHCMTQVSRLPPGQLTHFAPTARR